MLVLIALLAMTVAACASSVTESPPDGAQPVNEVSVPTNHGVSMASSDAAPAGHGTATLSVPTSPPPVDFAADVRPILEARCMPCHFAGGKMYAELPFDQPVTIYLLGEKLFTRVREPAEQETIRAFLAQQAAPPPSASTATPPPPAG